MGTTHWNRIVPILQWSVSEDLNTERKQIRCSWEQHRGCHLDDTQPVPAGWTRHRCLKEEDGIWYPSQHIEVGCNYFTHERIPGTQFWFPIPITNDDPRSAVCASARYLHCKTQRTWLWEGGFYSFGNPFLQHPSLLVHDGDENWAGILHLHHGTFEDFPTNSNKKVELIALSQGFAFPHDGPYHGFEEFEIDQRLWSGAIYNFYNVMWIEWENGIAYRKAIGRVLKATWEQQ